MTANTPLSPLPPLLVRLPRHLDHIAQEEIGGLALLAAAGLSRSALVLADIGRQVLIGREELTPPRVGAAALISGEVGGEIFDMDLDPRPVGGEMVQGHAPFLPDQEGVVAVGGQRDLDDMLARLARLLGQQQQPPRGPLECQPPRVASAVGEGATAIQLVHEYLREGEG